MSLVISPIRSRGRKLFPITSSLCDPRAIAKAACFEEHGVEIDLPNRNLRAPTGTRTKYLQWYPSWGYWRRITNSTEIICCSFCAYAMRVSSVNSIPLTVSCNKPSSPLPSFVCDKQLTTLASSLFTTTGPRELKPLLEDPRG